LAATVALHEVVGELLEDEAAIEEEEESPESKAARR
jgi:hypothetical protein